MSEFDTNRILVAVYCCGSTAATQAWAQIGWMCLALYCAIRMAIEYRELRRRARNAGMRELQP